MSRSSSDLNESVSDVPLDSRCLTLAEEEKKTKDVNDHVPAAAAAVDDDDDFEYDVYFEACEKYVLDE